MLWQVIEGVWDMMNWGAFAAVYVPLNIIVNLYLLRANRGPYTVEVTTPRLGNVKVCGGCYRLMPEDAERLEQRVDQDIANWAPKPGSTDADARQAMQEMPISAQPTGPGSPGHTGSVAPEGTSQPCFPVRMAPNRAVPWVGRFPGAGIGGTGAGGSTVQGSGG